MVPADRNGGHRALTGRGEVRPTTQMNRSTHHPTLRIECAGSHGEDLRLVQQALGGDAAARQCLALRLLVVKSLVSKLDRDYSSGLAPADLEDISQDALGALWSRLDRFEGRSTLTTWAWGFAYRFFLTALTRRQREQERAHDLQLVLSQRASSYEQDLCPPRTDETHCLIERLPSGAQHVIHMKVFQGFSFREVGERLGISDSTAKSRYYRALHVLRRMH